MAIRSFRHLGIRDLFNEKSSHRVSPDHVERLRLILRRLDTAQAPVDMDIPGLRLHRLTGNLRDHYAVSVSGNWRITFRFAGGHVADVDYVDYH